MRAYHTSIESSLQLFLLRVYRVQQPLNNVKYCPITTVAVSNDSPAQDPINYFSGGLIFSHMFAVCG